MPQHPLNSLGADAQQYVSLCCRDYHSLRRHDAPNLLEEQVEKAPPEARFALLCELLTIEIEHAKLRTGRLPTLHELCHAHPKLSEQLPKAYAWVPAELRLPDMLGRYKVLKMLGEGGQSCVVLGRDELDGRLVAVKYATEAVQVSLLRRERTFLSTLAHKNIIDVLGSGDEPGTFYVVLPLLHGESLQLAYAQHRPDPALAAKITLQIARAVAHMHAQNVVHRDIKPANVHLNPESPAETVVLLDLGMAVDIAAWNSEARRILEHGGTKAYMAPEQLASDESSDPKLSDVFAIGAVLYFLLVGEPPLDRTASQTRLNTTKASETLKAICRRSLQTRPADRQASAAELSRELEQFLAVSTARRAIVKNSLPAVSVGVLLASLVLIWSYASGGRSREALPRDADQSSSSTPLDHGKLTAADFQVSVEPDLNSHWVVGGNPALLRFPGRLAVLGAASTDAMLTGAEFRLHDGPWKNFYLDTQTNRPVAELTEADLQLRGPLYIRFTGPSGIGSPTVCGPFRYSLYLDESLGDIMKQAAGEIAKEWTDSKYQWATNTIFVQEWKLLSNRFRFPWTPVVELRFGPSATQMIHSIDVASHGLQSLQGMERATESQVHGCFYRLITEFEAHAAPMNKSHSLFAQLRFFDGSLSEVREFLADSHPQSEQSIQLRKASDQYGFGGVAEPLTAPLRRPGFESPFEKKLRELLRPRSKE